MRHISQLRPVVVGADTSAPHRDARFAAHEPVGSGATR
jgi:hypothetical protein